MLKIFEQITSNLKEYLVLSILIILSLTLMSTSESKKLKMVRKLSIEIVGFMESITNIIPNLYALKRENEELRKMNMLLMDEVNRLREEKLENIRLRKLLDFKAKIQNYDIIPADIVGKKLINLHNYLVLNVGENDGVRKNMPVVSENGAVGKIQLVGKNYSIAIILLHKDFRVSVKTQRSRVDGILTWDGGEYLSMINVPKTMDVQPGDVIITSEYSTIFPTGIEVGTVVSVDNSIPGLFKRINIKPAVNFVKLEEVFILRYTPDYERIIIEKSFQK
jgi:rod shape-determining protein MreC